MDRRQFVFRVSTLIATYSLASLSFRRQSDSYKLHVCSIEVAFLKKQTLRNFKNDREQWMNFEEFERVISEFKNQKLLVKTERSIENTAIKISYYFKDRPSHDKFVNTINNADTVGELKMAELGYRFFRKYYQI